MIQIIDIKDKMLYNEVKAEKKYLTLMNATVSHELRNPLNSLVSGIENMESYYNNLRQILLFMKNNLDKNIQNVVYERLKLVFEGLETNSTKITSSAKFVDYFVHDMLDYTVLTNSSDSSNFTKIISKFDIRNAIKEIYEILEDKASIKEIQVKINYENFDGNYFIKTDYKRLQQVLLNLFSNAIKFTDRRGKIQIKVKLKKNHVKIYVIDSGIGIQTENHGKLFQLFGSYKDAKRHINTNGIGLGLVISKMIV